LNYATEGKCYGEGGSVYTGTEVGNGTYITLSASEIQANCAKYGRLYSWATAMGLDASCNSKTCSGQIQPKHKGVCPSGWHIPSKEEWSTLENFVGLGDTGYKLKTTSGWQEFSSGQGNGTDNYGFAALPSGRGSTSGNFNSINYGSYWWSTMEKDAGYSYYRYLDSGLTGLGGPGSFDKGYLFSIRCIQD